MTMDPCMVGFQCSLCMSLCVCLSQCLNVAFFRIETDRSGETRSLYLTGCTCVCLLLNCPVAGWQRRNCQQYQVPETFSSVCLSVSDYLRLPLSVSICLCLSLSVSVVSVWICLSLSVSVCLCFFSISVCVFVSLAIECWTHISCSFL